LSRVRTMVRAGRRAWPILLMGWERWQKLPQHEKDRYKRQAQEYAQRGRKLIEQRRRKKR
jgi:TRAP-type C4-dicarboxylate transport system substrate-binding protein